VTAHPSVESAVTAVDLGLVGYLPKPFEPDDLVSRVEDAIERRRMATLLSGTRTSLRDASETLRLLARQAEAESPSSDATGPLMDAEVAEQLRSLTPRERDIVLELLDGYRLSTIARRLGISTHTVRRHLKNIFLKLEVSSQAELLE
jgi:RNA polymerase sigma factor (sigma-70 family)